MALVNNTNANLNGRYLFQVRDGNVIPGGVPEPATWAMLILGMGIVGAAMRKRQAAVRYSFA